MLNCNRYEALSGPELSGLESAFFAEGRDMRAKTGYTISNVLNLGGR